MSSFNKMESIGEPGRDKADEATSRTTTDFTTPSPKENADLEPRIVSPQQPSTEALLTEMREIRALLTAAAKHFSIEIPRETPESTSVGILKPNLEAYDEQAVIDYQLNELPSSGTSFPSLWQDTCGMLMECKVQPLQGRTGWIPICEWWINVKPPILKEYGYDPVGCLCRLGSNDRRSGDETALPTRIFAEHLFLRPQQEEPDYQWAGQRFVKELTFDFAYLYRQQGGILIGIDEWLSLLDWQMYKDMFYPQSDFSRLELCKGFVDQFVSDWKEFDKCWANSGLGSPQGALGSTPKDIILQYHLRFMVTEQGTEKGGMRRLDLSISGSRLQRAIGYIHKHSGFWLRVAESRCSIGLKTTWGMDLPVFSLMTLSEFDVPGASFGSLENEVQPHARSTGVAAFALRISQTCHIWEQQWSIFLDGISALLNDEMELKNILSSEERAKLMYDDPHATLSETYWAILQLLRKASDWIEESITNLRELVDIMERTFFSTSLQTDTITLLPPSEHSQKAAAAVFRQDWEVVLTKYHEKGQALLQRISQKKEVVENLREGLFNATAIQEAAKSKTLNHYIIVFTTVTIFYLPLSFVAALFALELFKWDNSSQTVAFAVTTVLVAGGTYCFAGLLIWGVRKPETRTKPLVKKMNKALTTFRCLISSAKFHIVYIWWWNIRHRQVPRESETSVPEAHGGVA
ncbi:hypothetical protein NM208_g9794 [Fusarium decemcellulare]|uniref:Uncharacterized protein n=1 Tax=Fusarium decemcellulare TaxID=57161 RepID=A0ACC1S0A4_9HYPO|nr:hypothetical protein NM208_g9794 [Fusarium decemcellulare]